MEATPMGGKELAELKAHVDDLIAALAEKDAEVGVEARVWFANIHV